MVQNNEADILLEKLNNTVQAYTYKCLRNIEEIMKDVYVEDPTDDGVKNDFISTIASLSKLKVQEALLVKSMIHSKMDPSMVKVIRDGVRGIVMLYMYNMKALDKIDIEAHSEFDADESFKAILSEIEQGQPVIQNDAEGLNDATSILREARHIMDTIKS